MRKIFSLFLMMAFLFLVAACKTETTTEDLEGKDIFKPVFYGLLNTRIEEGDEFDPLEGVTAIDDVDGDVTDKIEVFGEVDVNKVGSYLIEYRVKDSAGNEKIQYRQITVDYKFAFGRTYNGDFSDGLNKWGSWFGEGGSGSVTVTDEEYVAYKADSIGSQFWSTQFFQEGIGLEAGKTYKVTFDAKADIARKLQVKMENPVTYADVIFDITAEWKTYEFTFEMGEFETNKNAKLNFFIGKIAGDDPATTVYLDNITLTEVTE